MAKGKTSTGLGVIGRRPKCYRIYIIPNVNPLGGVTFIKKLYQLRFGSVICGVI